MIKKKKAKFVIDQELGSIKDIKSIKQVAEDQEAYDDILKDATITRVANKGDNFITQTITYNVKDIEVDWDSVVYKYMYEGEEYYSNFLFNNPVETIYPQINNNDTATA